ncbi:MAG: MFS transporter, partial [Mycobacteriaceae bacterium]|nr:MFS transporter [Mycobacteriaceae bacterium]
MDSPTVRRARRAVAVVFAVHGCVSGTFAARVPWIQQHLQLDAGQLGLALVMPALGGLATLPFAGAVVDRLGGRTATRMLISAWCLALTVMASAPNRWILMVVFAAAGAAAATSDMAMNAEGVAVEKALDRPVMSGLHGMWSVGALAGGGAGAAAVQAGLGAPAHFAVAGGLLLMVGAAAAGRL